MDKQQAIKRFREINGGAGVDRQSMLEWFPRGSVAVANWNDGLFTLGIEYGVLLALTEVFDLQPSDIA